MEREYKPFMVSREQIEDYEFTKKQKAAYAALTRAAKRCQDSGLSLLAKQSQIWGIPSKFYMNDMVIVSGEGQSDKHVECPMMNECQINDSGADDGEFIKDKYIK